MQDSTASSSVVPGAQAALAGRFLPHHRRAQWLGRAQAMALLDYAIENESRFEPATIRTIGGASIVDRDRRSSLRIKDLGPFADGLRERILETLPLINAALGVPTWDPKVIEVEMVAHGNGAFYRRHNDTFGRHSVPLPRRISMVYYFHRLPKAFTGGELRYYSLGSTAYLDIEPACDQLVAFPSWAPHSVERVTVPSHAFADARFALNMWIGVPATSPVGEENT